MTEVQSDSANINTCQYTYTYSEKNISLEVHYVGASMWVHFSTLPFYGLQCSQPQLKDVVWRILKVASRFCLSSFNVLANIKRNFYKSLAITIHLTNILRVSTTCKSLCLHLGVQK